MSARPKVKGDEQWMFFAGCEQPFDSGVSVETDIDKPNFMIDMYYEMLQDAEASTTTRLRVGRLLKELLDVKMHYTGVKLSDKDRKQIAAHTDVLKLLKDNGIDIGGLPPVSSDLQLYNPLFVY